MQNFDGEIASQFGVSGLVDFGHATTPNQVLQRIFANGTAGVEGEGSGFGHDLMV
jgi:hypothetical protein